MRYHHVPQHEVFVGEASLMIRYRLDDVYVAEFALDHEADGDTPAVLVGLWRGAADPDRVEDAVVADLPGGVVFALLGAGFEVRDIIPEHEDREGPRGIA